MHKNSITIKNAFLSIMNTTYSSDKISNKKTLIMKI